MFCPVFNQTNILFRFPYIGKTWCLLSDDVKLKIYRTTVLTNGSDSVAGLICIKFSSALDSAVSFGRGTLDMKRHLELVDLSHGGITIVRIKINKFNFFKTPMRWLSNNILSLSLR